MIYTGLDYIPISLSSFFANFKNLFINKIQSELSEDSENYCVIGYSCRSLFHTTMKYFKKNDITVVTTPIHHTSFRNIIEKYVKPENIHIIEMNDNYNEIKSLPSINKCDLLVVSHLFGQDLKFNKSLLNEFKRKHNCLFLEDRVQGGSIKDKFSSDLFDLSYYSCGMDKRPVALGGGFMFIRKSCFLSEKINKFIIQEINSYNEETIWERFIFLIKKIPTYLLYNYKLVHFIVLYFIKFLVSINFYFNVNSFAEMYRKKNPGFSHNDYLKKPSKALLKSIKDNFNNYLQIEENYSKKFNNYISLFKNKKIFEFYPWYNNNVLLTPYHSCFIEKEYIEDVRQFLLLYDIVSIVNPTYKIFNHQYPNKNKDEYFNNSILYLPSLANMNTFELKRMYMILFMTSKYLYKN